MQTEPKTEPAPETEKETENVITIPQYDFSDDAIKTALLEAAASEPDDYEDRTLVSDTESVRERHIRKGTLGAVLYSFVPGRESSSVEIVSTDQNLLMQMVKALGIPQDESEYSNLFNGAYDGVNAGVIGLKDISRWQEENGIHMRLDRTEEEASDMEWEEAGTASFDSVLSDSLLTADLRTQEGLMSIVSGVEYDGVVQEEFTAGSPVIERDQGGEIISAGGAFSAEYTAGNRTYEISSGMDREGIIIKMSSEEGFQEEEAVALCEHIYQNFYHGEFCSGFDENGLLSAEHVQAKKNMDGSYSMEIF